MEAGDKYKAAHDVKATQHSLKEGDFAYLDNQLFLGKNKKFAQRWIGPYLVTEVLNYQNVGLQISPRRTQVHSAYRLKKFIDPKNSKFLDKNKEKKGASDKDEQNKIVTDQLAPEAHERARNKLIQDKLIKSAIEKRITRSMSYKLLMKKQSSQSIVAINNLIIPELTKSKIENNCQQTISFSEVNSRRTHLLEFFFKH